MVPMVVLRPGRYADCFGLKAKAETLVENIANVSMISSPVRPARHGQRQLKNAVKAGSTRPKAQSTARTALAASGHQTAWAMPKRTALRLTIKGRSFFKTAPPGQQQGQADQLTFFTWPATAARARHVGFAARACTSRGKDRASWSLDRGSSSSSG